ncbi:MAG: hypothetical protein V1702_04065 [Candidatus Woesearchaeota archaeon]
MRIPLQIIQGRVIFTALVSSPRFHKIAPVGFFVDTGSTDSFFGKADALRLQIPVKSLSVMPAPMRMGGYKYDLKILGAVVFRVKNSEQKVETINFPAFAVAECTVKKEDALNEAHSFPSLIGTNFLEINKFVLYVDMANKEAYFER